MPHINNLMNMNASMNMNSFQVVNEFMFMEETTWLHEVMLVKLFLHYNYYSSVIDTLWKFIAS